MIKISACVIVKNEESNLPGWLTCAKALADELIVVDTGSTDRTAELALAAGAKIYDYKWCDDFSAAKNYALQKARGNWIVFLDADEYFSEEDIPKVRAYIHRFDKERNTAGFICPCVNIDVDRGGAYLSENLQIRVFRRHPDIRYHGHIHEMLQTRGHSWKMMQVGDVRVWHTGYSSGVVRMKAQRDLAILLANREKNGEQPSDAFYIADCCYGLQRFDEAIAWASKAIASGYVLEGRERRPYDVLLNSMLALRYPYGKVHDEVQKASVRFPDIADYKVIDGISAWQAKNYVCAAQVLEEALAMIPAQAGHIRAIVKGHLADIEHRRGRDSRALELAAESLQEERFYEPALSLICKIVRSLPSADIIQFLNTMYDAKADAEFLVPVLAKNGLHEVCLYYDGKAKDAVLSVYDRFFSAGFLDGALKEAAKGMARCCAMGVLAARRLNLQDESDAFLPAAFCLKDDEKTRPIAQEFQSYVSKYEQIFARD